MAFRQHEDHAGSCNRSGFAAVSDPRRAARSGMVVPTTADGLGARTSEEQFCQSTSEVRLCFQTIGDRADPALLLIMGLGGQMIVWPEDFCELLASRGYYVIRFDNRDCGRSTHLDHVAPPTAVELATRRFDGLGYCLGDMASDAVALLDHLAVETAHVVGASMGGMIAQTLAISHAPRTLSLTSIMSNTGSLRSGQPALAMWPRLLRPLPSDRQRFVNRMAALLRAAGSPGFEVDEREQESMLALSHDRGFSRDGYRRQLGAVMAAGNRAAALGNISIPTLVIHGRADRLVSPSGGRATAAAIPGSSLLELGGMGHDLPRELWPLMVDAISANAERGDSASTTRTALR